LTDSVTIRGQNYAPQLRIPLNSIGQRVLSADSSILSGNTNFLQFFKGINVTAQGAYGNGISYIDLWDSKITVYYHNSTNDSLFFDIPISTSSAAVNHYDHQYSSTIHQALTSTATSDSLLYIQSGAGLRVKLSIPSLDSLPSNIAINKAELVVSVLQGDTAYGIPSTILAQKINAAGSTEWLDATYENGGTTTSQTLTIDGNTYTQYRFLLNKYMQDIVLKQYPNNGLYLTLAGASSANRVVLTNYRNADPNLRIKLNLIYSKLE
jgi:hypothetical protein